MSIYVGESRGELLQWLNGLLGPTITKVEECGKGFTYCQIIDSIYGNLPMTRVKFDARMEYEYLDNFKILQKAFKNNGIEKPIPVEKLVKCKMQDNLEFLQWMKKFWDTNNRGDGYDAAGRSGGHVPSAPAASSSRSAGPSARARVPVAGAPRTASGASAAQLNELKGQVAELQELCAATEKERDFYFDKLHKIELIVQQRINLEDLDPSEKDALVQIQEILYATEEGFELPANGEEPLPEDEETF
ncbi:calponin homology domain-containing protein [Papiliotrema laurentii]|uniref:Calponin homology domain-containing protein n=1 Tax=Papiliotrema laurentii TaxID=5418 RepID=A0AAD9FSA4_PAPLA|nr:calponin homology domain-containing protein [Papiliotrema laurentii]